MEKQEGEAGLCTVQEVGVGETAEATREIDKAAEESEGIEKEVELRCAEVLHGMDTTNRVSLAML